MLAVIAALIAGYAVIGLLLMRFVSPVLNRTVRRQLAMRRVSHAAQTIGATLVSIVMLFPIYWMIISSFKASDELLAPTPTLWPEQWFFDTYPNVLKRAPFGLYFFNT